MGVDNAMLLSKIVRPAGVGMTWDCIRLRTQQLQQQLLPGIEPCLAYNEP